MQRVRHEPAADLRDVEHRIGALCDHLAPVLALRAVEIDRDDSLHGRVGVGEHKERRAVVADDPRVPVRSRGISVRTSRSADRQVERPSTVDRGSVPRRW